MRGVDAEEAAAVGAELFDGDLRGGRSHRQGLGARGDGLGDGITRGIRHRLTGIVEPRCLVAHRFQRGDFLVGREVLDHALADQCQCQIRVERDLEQDGGDS